MQERLPLTGRRNKGEENLPEDGKRMHEIIHQRW